MERLRLSSRPSTATGPYQSIANDLAGFDNPGWEVYGDDGFAAGGLRIFKEPADPSTTTLTRDVVGRGSFETTLVFRDLSLGNVPHDASFSIAAVGRLQELNPGRHQYSSILVVLSEADISGPSEWWLNVDAPDAPNIVDALVPRSTGPMRLQLTYDDDNSTFSLTYDPNLDDNVESLLFGPFEYQGIVRESGHRLELAFFVSGQGGPIHGLIDLVSMQSTSAVPGDFNGNGAADIDRLSAQIRAGSSDLLYDINTDSVLDDLDRQVWIHDLKQTFFGDTNLNGTFDSTDLVQVLASGHYEDDDALNSTWLTGDWDGDGEFTSGDLVVALADGGYDVAPRAAAVPEPAGAVLAIVAAAWTVTSRRPKTRRK